MTAWPIAPRGVQAPAQAGAALPGTLPACDALAARASYSQVLTAPVMAGLLTAPPSNSQILQARNVCAGQ